jgi:hypothetical protein
MELEGFVNWLDYHLISIFVATVVCLFLGKRVLETDWSIEAYEMAFVSLFLFWACSPLLPWVLPFLVVIGGGFGAFILLEILFGKFEIRRRDK